MTLPLPTDLRANVRVLVVDDEPAIRDMLFRFLSHAGYEVHLADSGKTALMFLHTNSTAVDILLTDLRMPRIDGATLAAIVQYEYSHIGIVIMSALPDDPAYVKTLHKINVPVLHKLTLRDALVPTLQEVVRESQSSQEARSQTK